MKILFNQENTGGTALVVQSLAKVFSAIGHQCLFYSEKVKSSFDIFSEFQPDLFCGYTFGLSRAILKNIIRRPEMRVVLYASAWGPLVDNLDREKYPMVYAGEEEKATLAELKNKTGKPDFIWLHLTERFLDGVLGNWKSIGIKPVGILNAADTFDFGPAKPLNEFKTDVCFVGGFWPYKSRTLNKFIVPLCHNDTLPNNLKDLKIKIFGHTPWSVPQYLGYLQRPMLKHLFNSATICPNVSELHSEELNFDVVERPYQTLYSKAFTVSDYVESMDKDIFTNKEVLFYKTYDELTELIYHFRKHPEERLPYIERGYETVKAKHTYIHRAQQFMTELGLPVEAVKCQKLLGDIP